MTQEQVSEKIDRLTQAKSGVIRKSSLTNENNNALFYSQKSVRETSQTEGVTPMAIAGAMGKIEDVILEYVDEMKGMPYIKTSPIQSHKVKTKTLVEKGVPYQTALLRQIGADLHLQDALPFMAESKVVSAIDKIIFSTGITIKSEDGADINYEAVLYKINSFSNDITTYRAGVGNIYIEIPKNEIKQDDIYIMGIVFKEAINPNVPYYVDLSFLVEKKLFSAEKIEIRGTLGGKKIGLQNLDIDTSFAEGMLLSSLFGMKEIVVKLYSEINTSTLFTIGETPFSPAGKYENNRVSQIGTRGKVIQISDKNISLWGECMNTYILHVGTYDLFESEEESKEKVIFNNMRPIDFSVQEAIDDL